MKTINNLQDLVPFCAYGIFPEIEITTSDSVVVWHDQNGQYYLVNTIQHPYKPDFNYTISVSDKINIPVNNYDIVSIQDLIL